MQVTKLQPSGNKKYLVFIDGEIAFALYKGDLRHYRISDGGEMTQEIYNRILEETLLKRAKLRLMHLLEKKDYTESQLRRKLREGYYPDAVIGKAVQKIKDCGYVDDGDYASRYIESRMKRKSARQITAELRQKGIDRSIIQNAFLLLESEGIVSDDYQVALDMLSKRHFVMETADEKEWNRQLRYLLSKGISYETAGRALRKSRIG